MHFSRTTNMILIDAERLAASRPNRPLFGDVSVTIADGDRVGVVGLDGSGKSTLLRMLAGELRPETGEVRRGRGVRRRGVRGRGCEDGLTGRRDGPAPRRALR